MNEPMIFYPRNFCTKCKSTALELYSWNNFNQKFSKMIKDQRVGKPIYDLKYTIYTMRCSNCGEKYNMIWTQGDPLPKPMRGNLYKALFMSEFKENSIKGKAKLIDSSYSIKLEENKDE